MTRLLLLALLLGLACSSPEREERVRVSAGIERLRSVPSSDLSARARAADELAALAVSVAGPRAARDACAKAYRTSTEMYELLGKLEAQVRADEPVDNPKQLAEDYRRVESMRDQAAEELDVCNARAAELAQP